MNDFRGFKSIARVRLEDACHASIKRQKFRTSIPCVGNLICASRVCISPLYAQRNQRMCEDRYLICRIMLVVTIAQSFKFQNNLKPCRVVRFVHHLESCWISQNTCLTFQMQVKVIIFHSSLKLLFQFQISSKHHALLPFQMMCKDNEFKVLISFLTSQFFLISKTILLNCRNWWFRVILFFFFSAIGLKI